jgi:hypothetical protein
MNATMGAGGSHSKNLTNGGHPASRPGEQKKDDGVSA